jgi:hypothetical protein
MNEIENLFRGILRRLLVSALVIAPALYAVSKLPHHPARIAIVDTQPVRRSKIPASAISAGESSRTPENSVPGEPGYVTYFNRQKP